MDNLEIYYRTHSNFPESLKKYMDWEYGVKRQIGIVDSDFSKQAIGLYVDYTGGTTQRLGKASGLTAGADFDRFPMFGGRRRCTVLDDGTITAYYGDENFVEDGSNGQVMVYQPKFYYRVDALETDDIDTGIGKHLRKANYWVSDKQLSGFKLHPAFYDESGNTVDYILISAYEGSLYDTSENEYITDDAQVMDANEDKLCSILGVKPASGKTQALSRPNVEKISNNRGVGWHGLTIKIASMEQMLMLVEHGTANVQASIGRGVVSTSDSPSTTNNAAYTGSTSSLGNSTGRASETTTERDGTEYTETADGKISVAFRGVENFWGNIVKSVYGINITGSGSMGGGQPYICSDYSFAESKYSDNYRGAGFTISNSSGYVTAFGYDAEYDWLFIPSECSESASEVIGDKCFITANLNGSRTAFIGGYWSYSVGRSAYSWTLTNVVGTRNRIYGGRLVYVPQ